MSWTNEETNLFISVARRFIDLGIDGRIDLLLRFFSNDERYNKKTDEENEIIYFTILEHNGLRKYNESQDISLPLKSYLIKRETLQIMVEENLISRSENSPKKYILTSLGHRIIERKGWLIHIEKQDYDKATASTLIQSNLSTNTFIELTLYALAISVFFQIISIVVTHCDAVEQIKQSGLKQLSPKSQTQTLLGVTKHEYLDNDSLPQTLDTTKKQIISTKN